MQWWQYLIAKPRVLQQLSEIIQAVEDRLIKSMLQLARKPINTPNRLKVRLWRCRKWIRYQQPAEYRLWTKSLVWSLQAPPLGAALRSLKIRAFCVRFKIRLPGTKLSRRPSSINGSCPSLKSIWAAILAWETRSLRKEPKNCPTRSTWRRRKGSNWCEIVLNNSNPKLKESRTRIHASSWSIRIFHHNPSSQSWAKWRTRRNTRESGCNSRKVKTLSIINTVLVRSEHPKWLQKQTPVLKNL